MLASSTVIHSEREPRGGTLDAAWPRTPVAHLAFETDTHFTTITCPTTWRARVCR